MPIHGARYILPKNRVPDLAEFIERRLPGLDLDETLDFYEKFRSVNPSPADCALLACNDLFYLLVGLCNRRDACHPWLFDRVREVEAEPNGCLDLWARGHYKDLAQDTPVLTTMGWKAHGELVPGDQVLCPDGTTSRVKASRSFTDSRCYRVTFCNGVQIVAGAGHLWNVQVCSRQRVPGAKNKRVGRSGALLTTEQLRDRLDRETYRIGVLTAAPLKGEDRALPIDPYVLGVWLGDGFSNTGAICGIDHDIFREIERRGYALKLRGQDPNRHPDYRVATIEGLSKALRLSGLKRNKHIPIEYLTASESDRRSLLWGLIDTDGSVGKANACVTFANTNRRLIEDVQTLANSLGYKARISPARSSNSWHVTFVASAQDAYPPCWLPRKRAKLQNVPRHNQSKTWYICSIEPIDAVPTNCIEIEASHGMYLAGRELIPTHNSSIITFGKTIQDILVDPEMTFGIFSYSRQTASKFLAQIMSELQRNEALKTCFPDVLHWKPETEAERWSLNTGIVVKRHGNPKEATVEAWGLVEGQPTGVHFKALVFDDMIEQRNVTNPEQIQKATEAWELSDNLGVGPGTIRRYVGTRYALGDTYQTLIDRKVVKVRLYPATDNGRIEGNPVFWDRQTWEEKKRTQRSTLPAQLLQNPAAGKQAVFDAAWFHSYEIRPASLNVYIMCDPSRGRTTRSDRTAMAVVGIDAGGVKYLLDGVRHRMKLSERWQMLLHLFRKWSDAPGVQMIRVGYERFGQQTDQEYFEEQQRLLKDPRDHFAIEELAWPNEGRNSKGDRVQRLQPDFEGARFLLPPLVKHPDLGECYWVYNKETKTIDYRPAQGPSKLARAMEHQQQRFRVPKPIVRLDENGDIYDVTKELMGEMLLFPYGSHDDLVDAVSRIYDLEPAPATQIDRIAPELEIYPDA